MKTWRLATFLLVCGASIVLAGTGCEFHPDPTEQTFYVKIVNDTPRSVVLSYCGTDHNLCDGKVFDSGTLKPGANFPSAQTSVGASDPWLVQTPSGRRL